MKHRFLYTVCFLLMLLGAGSCVERDLFNTDPIGEGEATLKAEVVFSPVLSTLSRTSTRAAGDAIKQVNSLCVFIYDKDGKLVRRVKQEELGDLHIEQNGNVEMPEDAITNTDDYYAGDDPKQAEDKTPKATFTIDKVPFGQYYIYAVANMGNLDEGEYNYSDDDLRSTPEKLKEIPLTWNPDDVSANNQMFGYFTPADAMASNGFDAPLITVRESLQPLHAWIKRAASKVTVAVDGSDLYPSVQVWIKSIQVRYINKTCFLGKQTRAAAYNLEPEGEKIEVSTVEGAEEGNTDNLVTNAHNYPANMESAHTQTAPALFFYENMQGNGQLKQQVWPDQENKETPMFPDGNDPNSKGFMDNMPEGTFVEVIGYYKNAVGEGPIIYRFMLGKNITDNYDAQRNYHFKLTLKLKNNGNDNDWHIVYDQEPDIIATVPYYISYLYNQTMDYPIKIVGGELVSLRADIPETIPQEAVDEINDNNPTFHVSADVNKTSWAPKAGEVTHEDELAAEAAGGVNVYWDGDVNNPGPWNGFLSLRKTEVSQFGLWQNPDGTKDEDFGPNGSKTYTYNKTYWDENNRGWRVYDVKTMGLHRDATDGDYTISRTAPGEYTATLPLYTRARVMVSQTGYSGNNPYAAYQRMAVIKVTAKIKRFGSDKIEEIEKYLPVIQSRRVLNPKAIWRESHNKDPFHVQLKILPYQTASSFEPLKSDGPWRAEIQSGNWFELIPTAGVSQKNPDGSISGLGNPYDMDNNPGCAIDFTFKPNGTIGDNETQGGIIRIYYNNYSCVHTIFVRQGYAPVSFYNSNTMWHTSNLRTGGYENGVDIGESYEAPDPELEGAYFKKYNRRYPISAAANTRQWALVGSQTTGTYAGNPYTERTFPVITKAQIGANSATEMKWEDIKTDENSWKAFSKVIDVTGTSYANCRLPKAADWEEIINNPKTIYGFGVLYADGATETLEDIDLVYGATPEDHNSGRGMRGVIICDESVGTQIFLPTAATGYGRFKQLSPEERYNRLPKGHGGVIQYANRYTWYPQYANGDTNYGVGYHPLFYDLWQSEGTMYWLDENKALDINFNTLDFVVGNQDDLGLVWTWAGIDNSGTDAVHLRLVHDRPGSAAAARTAARTRAAKAKVVSKPKAFSKTRR